MAPVGAVIVLSMVLALFGGPLFGTAAPPTPTPVPAATAVASTPTKSVEVTPVTSRKSYTARPALTIDAAKSYVATIVTDKGTMTFDLFPKVAPQTVNSFVFLAREGFYNGLTFHRVVAGFVIQGGDPSGNGTGGPGYSLPAEFNATKHLTGTLAMARSQSPDSAGSQFYVTLAPQPGLDNSYTVFGQIITGMDVALRIAIGDVMRQVTVEEK
jgi:cyclophilin family peptidyl-prolyl cis-trans isomerase